MCVIANGVSSCFIGDRIRCARPVAHMIVEIGLAAIVV